MRIVVLACGLLMSVSAAPVMAEDQAQHRVVNVTTDSAPGWLPSPDLEQQALATANAYFSAEDGGHYDQAYAMLSDGMKQLVAQHQYVLEERGFQDMSGAVRSRRIVRTTWTKNPSSAALPGVYAAIDIAATFQHVDRYCGYLILHQPAAGDTFEVMRIERNFITNARFEEIRKTRSPAEADALWAELASHCPNFDS